MHKSRAHLIVHSTEHNVHKRLGRVHVRACVGCVHVQLWRSSICAELSEACHSTDHNGHKKRVLLWAEDDRNEAALIRPPPVGYGIDVAWADGKHHTHTWHV